LNKINIIENTLRDGLYILDFSISTKQIKYFSEKLLSIGFEHLEIGHGLGVGAYKKITSGFTDEELYKEMRDILDKNEIYSFFIPSISNLEDLDIPKNFGLKNIRVGVEAKNISDYYSTIEKVKNKKFNTALNLMKSYTVPPKEFANSLKGLDSVIDILYIVDSAGHMLPSDVKEYFNEIQSCCNFKHLGFHGHNNLGLASSNALVAMEHGATFIDTTLGGIGRSGGNISTEGFVSILSKIEASFNESFLLDLIDLSNQFRKFIESKGRSFSITEKDVLFGASGFHSSYENRAREFSSRYGLDFNRLILEITKLNKISIDDNLLILARKNCAR
jgi:4-hydroxy 2-oxovalerate aldolase